MWTVPGTKVSAACLLPAVVLMLTTTPVRAAGAIKVDVDAARVIATVPELYNVGYNGWGDITYPTAVASLNDVQVKYCRIVAQLRELCGDRPGDYRWEYVTPPDQGLGFVSRIRKLIENGWTPIIAFSLHGGYADLPRWFHGENNDQATKAWFRYNGDGSVAADGNGDQYEAMTGIAHATVARLAAEGLKGLCWETIYEMGAEMPLAEIHYHVARGIRDGDASATIMGPATWPGWTVEERFLKPYLAKYGPELLDYVSLHWYGSGDHELWALGFKPETDIVTMADRKYLEYLLSMTPKYALWTQSLRTLLDDRTLNPSGKHIGIAYTEFDVVAQSPYQRNPENPAWPDYDPAADCYVNSNVYGGVWSASVLCNLAAQGKADVVCKFNARNYYGLIDNGLEKTYYRQPVWFAWKLLQQRAGMKRGATMISARVEATSGPAEAEVFAVGDAGRPRVILINKSFSSCTAESSVLNLTSGAWVVTRYLYDHSRTARFIGRKPGSAAEGTFEGAPAADSKNAVSLLSADSFTVHADGGALRLPVVTCPPLSITVLAFERE
jgi:hypothetical protein